MIGNVHHYSERDVDRIVDETGCGHGLARDLLTLAGGDADLVIEVSNHFEWGVESVKNAIIDARFHNIEKNN